MKAALALIAGASLAACAGAAARSARPDEPAARLEDLAPLRAAFNQHPERRRVVALASPSCLTCVRGVAALGDLLRRRSDAGLDVLMVWERVEPVRFSRPPSAAVTEKLSDARTTQFWDPDQLVSAALRAAAASDPAWPAAQLPEEEGVIWDSVLLFPAGARWEQRPPTPSWAGGDIVDVIDELDQRLFKSSRMSAAAGP